MASPGRGIKRKFTQVDVPENSLCKKKHRDLQSWNRQKVECCLSCGSFYTHMSDLHSPLRFSDEIRVLQLQPSSEVSEDLIGDLIHVRLQDNPIYEAVSYTWADESGVAVQSGNLFIKSTNGVLKSQATARRHYEDQRNALERSEQVQMMTSIYQRAKRVLVFIGTPPDDHLKEYRELFDYIRRQEKYVHGKAVPRRSRGPLYNVLLNCCAKSRGKMRLRNTLLRFLSYSWFRRIWVIQEVIMGRAVTLYFGTFVIDWGIMSIDDVSLGFNKDISGPVYGSWLETHTTLISVGSDIAGDIPPVLRLKKNIQFMGASLIDLLSATHECAATDPRDKIFALLGMAKPEKGLQLPRADYTKSIEDVFAEAAAYCIRATGSLSILSSISSTFAGLASWVPDFSKTSSLSPLPMGQACTRRMNDFTSLRFRVNHCVADLVLLDGSGIFLDTVTHVQKDLKETRCTAPSAPPISLDSFASLVQKIFQFPSSFKLPTMLLHCPFDPSRFKYLPFIEPSAGVAAGDLLAIDLLAPLIEYQTYVQEGNPHFPFCYSTLNQLYHLIMQYGQGRSLLCGEHTMGIAPVDTRPGDSIWILSTALHPFVLRQQGENYQVIGACVVLEPNSVSGCPDRKHHAKPWCRCESCISFKEYRSRTNIEPLSLK